ncbi:MAG: hypothetical protein JWN44_2911 [Myxococcales bacterium]|nr:hypothetical protein [Myxococcales bacterium]
MKRLAVAIVFVAACGGARSPEGAVRALAEAAESGDRDAVYERLGPATRARLAADALKAAQAAGRREIGAKDLVAAGWSPPRWRAAEFDVMSRSGDRATVEVRGPAHERETVTCVQLDGEWRVELP